MQEYPGNKRWVGGEVINLFKNLIAENIVIIFIGNCEFAEALHIYIIGSLSP